MNLIIRIIPLIVLLIFAIIVFGSVSQGTYYSSEVMGNKFDNLDYQTRWNEYNYGFVVPLRFCEVKIGNEWVDCTQRLYERIIIERDLKDSV